MWQALITNFVNGLHFMEVCASIQNIAKADTTFPLYEFSRENLVISLRSEDKNNLHKRCLWLVKNIDSRKTCIYEVRFIEKPGSEN